MEETKIKQVTKLDRRYTGATCGFLDPNKPAKEILGKVEAGNVFIYMFRRFGYPLTGWDGQKGLVTYYLTTSMDGVILTVRPDVTGAGTFGYMIRKDIDGVCYDESISQYTNWHDRFNAWAIKEHNTEIIKLFEEDKDKLLRVWGIWGADKEDLDFEDQHAMHRAFFKDQEIIRIDLTEKYKKIEHFPKEIQIKDRDDNSILKQCHNALCDAIKDLKRPVYIRDVLINITGKLQYSDHSDDVVQYSKMAGIGVGNTLDPDQDEVKEC